MQNISAASRLLGRGSAGGSGDTQEIALGTGLSLSGTTLTVTGGGSGGIAFGDLVDAVFVRKTGDQTVTTSIVLINDTHLLAPIGASETWIFEFTLYYNSAGGSDIRVAVNVPSGATGRFGLSSAATTGGVQGDLNSFSIADLTDTGAVQAGGGGATDLMMTMKGIVINSTNAGDLQLRWAQGVSGGSTIIRENSFLSLQRVA